MELLNCVVHYDSPSTTYSKISPLKDGTHSRLIQARDIRTELGGLNKHDEQSSSIPDEYDADIHGIHLEPCYKKYTKIISQKRSIDESAENKFTPTRSKRLKHLAQFPMTCFFCGFVRKKINGKNVKCHNLTLQSSADTIQRAALDKEDFDVMRQIQGIDLIARGFHLHDRCRNEYIRKPKPAVNCLTFKDDNFESVRKTIKQDIIEENKAFSMKKLHEMLDYGHDGDSRYRSKLKEKILREFPDTLCFIQIDSYSAEIVTSRAGMQKNVILNDDTIVQKAAMIIRKDILDDNKTSEQTWPPNLDELKEAENSIPQSTLNFLSHLLHNPDTRNKISEKMKCQIKSYAADLIHGVSQGKVITLKHFILGLGLHNMTGQKNTVKILNNLGHCINYETVCAIESSQAKIAQMMHNEGTSPGLLPASNDDYVFTYFWADNFNKKIERDKDGMINSTHMVKFQEPSGGTIIANCKKVLPKLERVTIEENKPELDALKVNPKKNPPMLSRSEEISFEHDEHKYHAFKINYFYWIVLRLLTLFQALFPNFAGCQLMKRKFDGTQIAAKTVLTYLPPIDAPVTSFNTIYAYLRYMQKLSSEVNMPYVNVSLDVGAAINAYKLIWNHPIKFSNVVIHLGDFHAMKEIFSVLGLFVQGSGFEEIIFQSGMCNSGTLNGILTGSHYNRCWKIHEHFAEALEHLLMKRFLMENDISLDSMVSNTDVFSAASGNMSSLAYNSVLTDLFKDYEDFKEKVRGGFFGITPQFWVRNYLDVVDILHLLHISVHTADYDLRLLAWKRILPYFFALDRTNYSRYGSYYVAQLESLDSVYPGCKELLKHHGISVQGQERYPLRTAIDQRGEQTLNKDAKNCGGIRNFAGNSEAVTKWTLNRSAQALVTGTVRIHSVLYI